MGLFKIARQVVTAGVIFYAGYIAGDLKNEDEVQELNSNIQTMNTIDYKVYSLANDYIHHPQKVENVFNEYQLLKKDPLRLENKIQLYNLK